MKKQQNKQITNTHCNYINDIKTKSTFDGCKTENLNEEKISNCEILIFYYVRIC